MPLPATSAAVRSGFAALRANPLRTILSALGVVIGIGAMIAVLALSDGVETSFRERLAADGRAQSLSVAPRTVDVVDGLPTPRADPVVFTPADADSLAAAIGSLGSVDLGGARQTLAVVAPGRPARGVVLRGARVPPAALRTTPLAAGRFFTSDEVRRRAHVLVVSDGLAAALATTLADSTAGPVTRRPGDDIAPRSAAPARPQPTAAACRALVGRAVTIADAPWTIIGIATPILERPSQCSGKVPERGRFADRADVIVRLTATAPVTALADVPQPALPGAFPVGGGSAPMTLVATRLEDLKPMRQRAERWLAARYGASAGDTTSWKERVEITSYERESDGINQAMLIFRLLMSAITGISLVVGGVGIMNVLLASVTERTREIGISKAVGARRRDVLVQYLAESVAISLMGAVLGTALGYGVAQIVAAVMRSQATIPVHAGFSLSTLLVAIGAPLVVGVLFGMYPALRAARLSPIDAIRHE